jgi:hypothetical protein
MMTKMEILIVVAALAAIAVVGADGTFIGIVACIGIFAFAAFLLDA